MRFLFFLFLTLFHTCLFAQRSYFKSFSTVDGLAQSQVNSICQDSTGYLWIGTLGGISKYNGNTFKNYSTDNGLLNNRVNVIKWIDNKIFVGHQGGISIIKDNLITKKSLGTEYSMVNITDIVKFKGMIVIATNGEGLFTIKNEKLTHLNLLEDEFLYARNLLEWKNELYIATRGGVIRTKDLKSIDNFLPNNDYSISSLAVWNERLMIATFYNGLQYYNREKNQITRTYLDTNKSVIHQINVDSRNYIWVSTSEGIIKFNEKEQIVINNSTGLPFNVISTTFEDADKNIWIGTQGKGLVKASQLEISYFDQSIGLPSDIILSGFQTKDGFYYFGTMDKAVIKTKDFKNYQQIDIDPTVWCAIADIHGKHWFGTKYGLYSIDQNEKITRFDENDGALGFKITAFYKINNNAMYVGGSHGIVSYKNGTFSPVGKNGTNIGTVRNMAIFNKTLIVATDKGLFRLNSENYFENIGQLNRTIFSLVKTPSNKLFLGTEDGLYELSKDHQLKRIRYSQDVASNYINFLNVSEEDLIVGTNNGVYVINLSKKGTSIKRISDSDGLIDPETNINSSFIDNKNSLWFGTATGLVKLQLDKIQLHIEKATIKFDQVLLNFEPFNYKDYEATFIEGIPQGMKFPYNRKNLQFNFDGVAVNNYEDLIFQYKLEGQDDVWMPVSNESNITLRGLPAGKYTLHARISLQDGSEIDKIKIDFEIKDAFYKTWWFFTFLLLCVAALIYIWVNSRIKTEQRKNELERTEFKARLITLEQQSLNASMNRHFIFNSLNSIQYFINISDKLSANKYLTSFAKLIRKNLDSSTEENGLVTLGEELERIKLYLSLEHMRFKGKFEYSINNNNVDLESILIPAMMIQPFVENSIIHGVLPQTNRLGKIEINMEEINETLIIQIKDNGIGIEESIAQKFEIDGDHKSQGMEITLKRIELIKKISGREMEIIGPKQLYNSAGDILGTMVEIKIYPENLDN